MDFPTNEIRIKLKTNIPELKLKDNLQSMIIKASMTRKELSNFVKKITKYQGSKELEFFINEKLFTDNSQVLSVFISEEEIKADEQIIEVFYTFKLDEPKLIDSKKEDEWIKKVLSLKNHDGQLFSVGLFNSEVNFYSAVSNEKINATTTVTKGSDDEGEYLFLNDYSLLSFSSNKNAYLLVKAIRDGDYCLNFEEVYISTQSEQESSNQSKRKNSNSNKEDKSFKVSLTESNYAGEKKKTITKLESNPLKEGIFASGTKTGEVEVFLIKNYEFRNNNPEKKVKRSKEHSKQTIQATGSLKLSSTEVTALKWMNESFILCGDLDYIKVVNSESLSLLHQFNVNSHLVTSLDSVIGSTKVVLSSHENGSIKVWDVSSNSPLVSNTNRAHQGFVSNIKCLSSNLFCTTGYDGDVKLWDLRKTTESYFDIKKKKDIKDSKVFGLGSLSCKETVGYDKLVFGGSDSELSFYQIDL